jgi:FkbM family methyltransferase
VTVRNITSIFPNPHRDFIYDILPAMAMRLAVDVGAATGEHTRRIRLAGGADLRVVALEPFPGNHPMFERRVADLDSVRLLKKAASDESGNHVPFIVPSVVQGTESGWQDKAGYSSVGFVAGRVTRLKGLKWSTLALVGRVMRRPPLQRPTVIHVETTTLDREFAGQHIDYLKVDVQGSEADVLRGATHLLSKGAIGLIYVEWPGGDEVLALLERYSYQIFDSVYVGAGNANIRDLEQVGFRHLRDVPLSIGSSGMEFALDPGRHPGDAMRAARRAGLAWIQTDLIAVSQAMRDPFAKALNEYAAS